jgi:tocopherol O-methyltransferase
MIYPKKTPTGPDVARHYDDLDVFYREVWGEHVHHGLWRTGKESPDEAVRQLVDRVAEEARLRPDDAVCDVGAGYGATARHLAAAYAARVTALTISPAQYAYACAQDPGAANPTYLLRDWLANGLPAEVFQAVVSIECVSHVPDKQRFFDEACRVLRPGGRLVVCAWLAPEDPSRWQERHVLEPICREGRLPSLADPAEYCAMMETAGFVLDGFEDLSAQVRRTWSICIRRVAGGLVRDRRYRRYLLDAARPNRVFALTLLRLWLGFYSGAFHYGLFTAHKPGDRT